MKRIMSNIIIAALGFVVLGCKHSETATAQVAKVEMQQVASSATIASLLVSKELTSSISLDSIHFDFLINDPDISSRDEKDKKRVRGRISAYGIQKQESDKTTLDQCIDSSSARYNKKELLDSLFKYKDVRVNGVETDELQTAAIVGSIIVVIFIILAETKKK